MTFSSQKPTGADITLTPLIDILFLVLMFLMLTATFTDSRSLRLSLPSAATGEPETRDGIVRIVVDAENVFRIRDEMVSAEEIGRYLTAAATADDVRVLLSADTRASHGAVVQVIDAVRGAGILRLSIDTLPTPNP